MGGTKFDDNWYNLLVSLFGFFLALSKLRDEYFRIKVYNIFMYITCRRHKCYNYVQLNEYAEKARLSTFL